MLLTLRDDFIASWRGQREPSWLTQVCFAALCLTAATGVRWMISAIRPDVPFTPYYPAILFGTIFGGVRLGVIVAICGGLLASYLKLNFAADNAASVSLMALYIAVSALVIWGAQHYRNVAQHYRQLSKKLVDEEDYRKLIVDELQHRLKNKVTTVQAVIRHVLRDQPDLSARIDGRILALSQTDELISRSDQAGCDLAQLLRTELEPYGHVRFTLNGPPVFLPARLAVSLALVFHELATNSGKYGAFSAESGLAAISWSQDAGRLKLNWEELNGPPVAEPGASGFGTDLLKRALRSFSGQVDIAFVSSGLHCIVTCDVPQSDV